jgi:hypothetical protein
VNCPPLPTYYGVRRSDSPTPPSHLAQLFSPLKFPPPPSSFPFLPSSHLSPLQLSICSPPLRQSPLER